MDLSAGLLTGQKKAPFRRVSAINMRYSDTVLAKVIRGFAPRIAHVEKSIFTPFQSVDSLLKRVG
tara:strand:- start:167 stop:361 length:195 start_codon:yes stop_codon:yes gene_type:complete